MASGTGERPLGTPEQEKELLGIPYLTASVRLQVQHGRSCTIKRATNSGPIVMLVIIKGNITAIRGVWLVTSSATMLDGRTAITPIGTASNCTISVGTTAGTLIVSNTHADSTSYVYVTVFTGETVTVTLNPAS